MTSRIGGHARRSLIIRRVMLGCSRAKTVVLVKPRHVTEEVKPSTYLDLASTFCASVALSFTFALLLTLLHFITTALLLPSSTQHGQPSSSRRWLQTTSVLPRAAAMPLWPSIPMIALTKGGKGGFKDTLGQDILYGVFKGLIERSGIDPALVEDISVGCVLAPGGGATEFRAAALAAGFPETAAVKSLNRQCSSGLQSCIDIANAIKTGMIDVGIGAGVESMTTQYGPQAVTEFSDIMEDHEEAANCKVGMGILSENMARDRGIPRAAQDAFAANSYAKAVKAQKEGLFKDEIYPLTVKVTDPKTDEEKEIVVDRDDGVREGITAESLGKIKAAFAKDGSIHAGNASQISDGAAAVLFMKRKTAEKLGQKILGKFVQASVVGVKPLLMGVGPWAAIPVALEKSGISKEDVDIFEINEAFASQCVWCINELGLPEEKINPKGARQVSTLLTELKRTGKQVGVSSMCVGTGMGVAAVWVAERGYIGRGGGGGGDFPADRGAQPLGSPSPSRSAPPFARPVESLGHLCLSLPLPCCFRQPSVASEHNIAPTFLQLRATPTPPCYHPAHSTAQGSGLVSAVDGSRVPRVTPPRTCTPSEIAMAVFKDKTNPWAYDLMLWTLSVLVDLFFREVHPRGSWRIPKTGPVIFVAAPHANQFIDPLILARVIRNEGKRRVAFLIAEKSMKRKWIGWFSGIMGAVSVGRALDKTKSAPGRIYLPDPDNDPTLLRGTGTNFETDDFQVGGLVVLPSINNVAANAEILEVLGKEELRLKKPFEGEVALQQLTGRKATGKDDDDNDDTVPEDKKTTSPETQSAIEKSRDADGVTFKTAPKVDQTKVYNDVFDKLGHGGCVGIFPEGGSHDRTELLPLKAGVAIMALGAVAQNSDCAVKIVPCGMNYFHAHKFRSRAVIEFGAPIDVPPELVEEFKSGSRRHAISAMLENVYDSLVGVTVTSPDYDTLMLIQAVRRLYNPKGKKLPLPMVVELNRRLVKGYTRYKDDPRIVNLKKNITHYNKQLLALSIRDHQLEYARLSIVKVLWLLLYRTTKILFLSIAVLPGLALFAPIFITGKVISIRKSKEALAASTVKIQARDVVATWKLLVAMALAPTLYAFDITVLLIWTHYNRVQGYVPEWVKLWMVVPFGMILFPTLCIAALRFGEVGMDIAKSLRPLVLSLNLTSSNSLVRLRQRRAELSAEVTDLINELGPEMFTDFDAQRIAHPEAKRGRRSSSPETTFRVTMPDDTAPPADGGAPGASIGGGSSAKGDLPRNESFKNLASFGFFASRPQTPSAHSRQESRSHSRPSSRNGAAGLFGLSKGFSPLQSSGAMEDVSLKIRGAMHERAQKRGNEDVELLSDDSGDEGIGLHQKTT
ncbi:hypothetical protein FH972_021206 [Carpinus fangiana]|uniref:Phospholipid/glycerol acyltransferase domain-containing protein n=1 Tax=Carpinus fangiana TaxID=176857 RepID=A0A5N6KP84_9ROSI|nr:hypothetical protein FH972_021206 [Carpinus fangiana]